MAFSSSVSWTSSRLREVFFRNIAELEARQRSDGVAQLAAAGCRWRAVEISAANAKGDVGIRRDWRGLRRQVQAMRSGIKSSTWKSHSRG